MDAGQPLLRLEWQLVRYRTDENRTVTYCVACAFEAKAIGGR
jgi:hypothetical protein